MIAGVDQGLTDPLDAEPALRTATRRLAERGFTPQWVVTHLIADEGGGHTAYAVTVEGGVTAGLAEALLDAFDPERLATPHRYGDGHDHPLPQPPAVVIGDAVLGNDALVDGARAARAAEQAADSGRAVVFPGSEALTGTLSAATLAGVPAIDEVVSLGGAFAPDTPVITRDHIRPLRRSGRWMLYVQPAAGQTLVPFEDPAPKECCRD